MLWLVVLTAAPLLEYRVTASAGAETLDVEVRGPGLDAGVTLDGPVLPYATVTSDGGSPLRYRFRLRDAARALNSRKWAFADGAGLYAAPSTWLMRPEVVSASDRFTLAVKTPPGSTFVTGLHRTDAGYEGPVWALGDAPWSGFADFQLFRDALGGATVETAIAPGALALKPEQVRAWVKRSASLVAAYYGRFPVPRVAVMVLPTEGDRVGFGTAMEETVMRHDWCCRTSSRTSRCRTSALSIA